MVSLLKSLLMKIDRAMFPLVRDQYAKALEKECVNCCETLLDVGCGRHSVIHRFSKKLKYTVGVDVFEPAIEESKKLKIHNEYKVMDVTKICVGREFQENSFDCVCALDVIEHLTKEAGLKLINSMEKIARKKVIIACPNGFLRQGVYDGNPFQVHISGWEMDEMRNMGYRVVGINGWKYLRGETGKIKWRPRIFWSGISLLSQLIVTNRPSKAFQILCVKDLQ